MGSEAGEASTPALSTENGSKAAARFLEREEEAAGIFLQVGGVEISKKVQYGRNPEDKMISAWDFLFLKERKQVDLHWMRSSDTATFRHLVRGNNCPNLLRLPK